MEKQFSFIWTLGEKWQAWLAVIVICFGLEAGAVFFQEVLMYYPCELCIYTRVWMTFMVLFAFIGLAVRKRLWPMRVIIIIETGLTVGLMAVVWALLAIEYGWEKNGACSLVANFPTWARLDEWLPTLFMVQDSCGKTPLVIFNLSMADGLAITSTCFLITFLCALYGSFRVRK
ncbi:disulfide bond formation protein B [Teredinibacter haidensis]|uniref:disulfide bond formation protein B n=1 Tax=Teredinibacter haidensis TaxID=2731755 RepID=UPI000948DB87|nr:disulfide bond formation protein B [Teredinibacter haidensis]